jgi:peroxiredoxin
MKRAVYLFTCILTSLGYAGLAHALSPGERVDNFRLLDQSGASHELYYHSDAKAIVLMAHGNGCDIVRNTLPALKELREKYRVQGVEFVLIDSNLQDSRDAIAQEAAEFGIDFPILVDETQLIGESLGVVRTADVFVSILKPGS